MSRKGSRTWVVACSCRFGRGIYRGIRKFRPNKSAPHLTGYPLAAHIVVIGYILPLIAAVKSRYMIGIDIYLIGIHRIRNRLIDIVDASQTSVNAGLHEALALAIVHIVVHTLRISNSFEPLLLIQSRDFVQSSLRSSKRHHPIFLWIFLGRTWPDRNLNDDESLGFPLWLYFTDRIFY